ncbi:hypothetical protein [Paenibacillus phocaensis]|uniref:hypothetical protein n=1 Tax=Paenibacillus phocaensis TaxID=1776378 RepID=UPI0018E274ED|nr:hypothetical protein [Paenibacillus phocaensis]
MFKHRPSITQREGEEAEARRRLRILDSTETSATSHEALSYAALPVLGRTPVDRTSFGRVTSPFLAPSLRLTETTDVI